MSTSCAACTSSFGMLCRFSDTLFIHPKCGADVRTPPQYQMLSTSGLKKRYGSKKHVLSAIASRKCRTAAGPFRFGNQSEMYLVSEFEVVMKEEEMRLNVGKKPKKPHKVHKYIQSVLDNEVATSLEQLKTLGHINDSIWINGKVCHKVKKSCRAYKAGLLEQHPTKRGFRGKPLYMVSKQYTKVKVKRGKKKKKTEKKTEKKTAKMKANQGTKRGRPASSSSSSPKKKTKH